MSWQRTAAICGFVASAALSGWPADSAGQEAPATADADVRRARALFAEGVALADREQWEEAEQRFREAQRLRASPSIAFNLALTLGHLGRLVEADELLAQVLADAETTDEIRTGARRRRAEIEPFIGRLTIRLRGPRTGVRVTVDGRPIAEERLREPLLVDPGRHEVVALRGDRAVARQSVELREDTLRVSVELVVPPESTPARVAPSPRRTPRATEQDRAGGGSAMGVAVGASLIGAGAIAGGAGIWALVTDGECAGGRTDADGDCELLHERTPAGIVLLVGGGVGLAAGTLVLLLVRDGSDDTSSDETPTVGALPLPGGLAITMAGRL